VPSRLAGEPDDLTWREVRQVLHDELGQLAERYRAPLVLCYLEGARQEDAARALGLATSTLKERLERGRTLLRARLLARGLGPSAVLVIVTWPGAKATAGVPIALLASTLQAATLFVTKCAAATDVITPKVAALAQGVISTMFLNKLKNAIALLVVVTLALLSTGALISRSRATEPAGALAPEQEEKSALRDDRHERLADLKQQLQRLQTKIARLEQEMLPRHDERPQRDDFLGKRFKYRIDFELGWSDTREGGRIDILEVWGTRPKIEVGGQYLVRGKYVLPPGERAKLYFYETATGDWSQPTTTMDLQTTTLDKQKGEFTLMHAMAGPGYFHLILADPERYSQYFANVYFGTGDNVLRTKP
jgi:hypothetical protein